MTYLGRQDTEKGIDLLLYAATILRDRGLRFQLAICGPTLFGSHYKMVCRQLAQDLRCPILRANHISDELRSALFFESRCIVYPSIHREPFGMVAAETLAHGTPAVVPDYGGIAGAIEAEGERGGLHFRVWDSGDLADTIARLQAFQEAGAEWGTPRKSSDPLIEAEICFLHGTLRIFQRWYDEAKDLLARSLTLCHLLRSFSCETMAPARGGNRWDSSLGECRSV